MNSAPLRIHIDETLVTIKQTFDDKVVSKAQVAFWYITSANHLLGLHNLKRDSGAFLSVFDAIPINMATTSSNPNVVKDRKHIELPGLIFDYDKDNGVEYLAYISDGGPKCPPRFTKTKITRTSPAEAQVLYLNPHTTPSPSNPYWYRVGNLIYFLGLEQVPVKFIEGGFYLTIDPLTEIDIDKPFNFPQELMDTLKRYVIDLARHSWFVPQERANEGTDQSAGKSQQLPKIISVNDQNSQAEQ